MCCSSLRHLSSAPPPPPSSLESADAADAVAALCSVCTARWTPAKVKFHDRRIGLIAAGTNHAIAVTGQRAEGTKGGA